MKKILVFLVLLGTVRTAFAANDTIWLNYKLDRIVRPFAEYYGIVTDKENKLFEMSFYNKKSNALYAKGFVVDTLSFIKKGPFQFYEQGSDRAMRGSFKKNLKDGKWLEYYSDNSIYRKSSYKEGKRNGIDTFYYNNAVIKRIDIYQADTVASGHCFDSMAKEIPYFPYEVRPRFIGNIMRYLGNNVQYPEIAKNEGGMGKVIVRFLVDTNGNFRSIKIVQASRGDLMTEAIRVLSLSQPWTPGQREGKPVEMYMEQPITFRIE